MGLLVTEAWRAKGKKEPSVRDNEDTEEMLNIHVMRACEVRERERENGAEAVF